MFSRPTLGTLGLTAVFALVSCSKKKSADPVATTGSGSGSADITGAGSGSADKKHVTANHAKPPGAPHASAHGKNAVLMTGEATAGPEQEDKGHLSLAYEGPDSVARKIVRDTGVFEKTVAELDKALNLPHNLPITFKKCGEENAFYDPDTITITMCDEIVDYYGNMFSEYKDDERTEAVVGALVSTFLHEMGHALIHQFQLPAVGRQEDAADQLSTVVLVASGDEGNQMALDGAYSWISEGDAQGKDTTPFWDEHSLNEQRFYNTMCLIYGSNPDRYSEVITENELPQDRAEQCDTEYKEISESWNKLLAPHLTVSAIRMTLPKAK